MFYTLPIIEQVLRAAEELSSDFPLQHRLALILVDNAVELIIHKRAVSAANSDISKLGYRGETRLTLQQRRQARGQHFDDKLSVLVALGDITAQERRFASVCHSYRNELYHVGLRHEPIIHAIGGAYLRWCVDLFGRLDPMSWYINQNMRLTPRAEAWFGSMGWKLQDIFMPSVAELSAELSKVLPATPPLATSLSSAAADALDEIEDSLRFLVDAAVSPTSPEEMAADVQRWREFQIRLEKEEIHKGMVYENRDRANEIHAEMEIGWVAPIKGLPIASWRSRQARLAKQQSELVVLDQYQNLRDTFADFAIAVEDAHAEVESMIEMQMDAARGK